MTTQGAILTVLIIIACYVAMFMFAWVALKVYEFRHKSTGTTQGDIKKQVDDLAEDVQRLITNVTFIEKRYGHETLGSTEKEQLANDIEDIMKRIVLEHIECPVSSRSLAETLAMGLYDKGWRLKQ